jgi:hypothetical protein
LLSIAIDSAASTLSNIGQVGTGYPDAEGIDPGKISPLGRATHGDFTGGRVVRVGNFSPPSHHPALAPQVQTLSPFLHVPSFVVEYGHRKCVGFR